MILATVEFLFILPHNIYYFDSDVFSVYSLGEGSLKTYSLSPHCLTPTSH